MNAKRRSWKRRYLIPLLPVILVALWVLAELAFVAVPRPRERGRRSVCRSTLRCIAYGSHLFATDNEERFPPTLGVLFCKAYLMDGKVFLCLSAGKATAPEDDLGFSRDNYTLAMFGDTHTDYVWVSGIEACDPHQYILAFDDEWNHDGDGVYVLFIGGNVEWTSDIEAVHEQLARQEKELAAQGRKMKLLRPAWSSWPDPPEGWRPWYARPVTWARALGALAALAAVAVGLTLVVRRARKSRNAERNGAGSVEATDDD